MNDLTVASNCYSADYQTVLSDSYFSRLFLSDNGLVAERVLTVNDIGEFREDALVRIEEKCIQYPNLRYFFTDTVSGEVCAAFDGCNRDSFREKQRPFSWIKGCVKNHFVTPPVLYDGWNYSIPVMTALYFCRTRYFLWMDEDAFLTDTANETWIEMAMDILRRCPNVFCVSPAWNDYADTLHSENTFIFDSDFSIQCFLVDADKVRKCRNLLNYSSPKAAKYPYYGGNCFEKRIFSFMDRFHLKRAVYLPLNYCHASFSGDK